jgi:hypothetical protein
MGAALGCHRGRGCGYVGSFVLLTMVLRAGMPVGVALIVAGVLTIEMGGAVN